MQQNYHGAVASVLQKHIIRNTDTLIMLDIINASNRNQPSNIHSLFYHLFNFTNTIHYALQIRIHVKIYLVIINYILQPMPSSNNKPLIKEKYFLFTLNLGLACITTYFLLLIDIIAHLQSCIPSYLTACSWKGYQFCISDGYGFCCGYSSGESCGQYIGSCQNLGDGFIQCDGILTAEWILGVASILIFVAMITMLITHRKKREQRIDEEQVMQPMQGNERRREGLLNIQ